jgi:hypothetical protein
MCFPCKEGFEIRLGHVPKHPAVLLEDLICKKSPKSPQIPLAQLMLAQYKLMNVPASARIRQDVAFAKREYLALADAGYGPAQHAVGCMYMRDLACNVFNVLYGPLHFLAPP